MKAHQVGADRQSRAPLSAVPSAANQASAPAANQAKGDENRPPKAPKKGGPLQDPFLNALRREQMPVSVYLVNGIKLQGKIESFDQFVILLANTVTQMVYKHAISTIVPGRPVNFSAGGSDED